MTTAILMINDLPLSQDLDQQAMCAIFGRGREAYQYNGSTHSQTGYYYTGNASYSFLGNVWFNGKWTKQYKSAYEYKNIQTRVDHFIEWWT